MPRVTAQIAKALGLPEGTTRAEILLEPGKPAEVRCTLLVLTVGKDGQRLLEEISARYSLIEIKEGDHG